eukprot:CAMPEP_0171154584 /NCGR_PEP_ID=MMETSP0790-20130122/407_1 /TAXON_ID=2925 /ORGANISM="Alexandrium catenella, Strain OF101" /LENGTH=103 /DNA_ID=CAMNT_0011618671 /DNA_START=172 /DNA_END=480 /DNA_ORIENTATION=+
MLLNIELSDCHARRSSARLCAWLASGTERGLTRWSPGLASNEASAERDSPASGTQSCGTTVIQQTGREPAGLQAQEQWWRVMLCTPSLRRLPKSFGRVPRMLA